VARVAIVDMLLHVSLMRLIDVVTSPWAISPDKLLEIREIYQTHLRGEKIDIKAVEARIGRPLNNEQRPYQVVNGVGLVEINGAIVKKANLFTEVSGGASTQLIGNMLDQAANDPEVNSIILMVDSPGGTVDGTQQLANKVRAIRDSGKTINAWIDGCGCSAGYWIPSGANKIFIADSTTTVGSIGVVQTHIDTSAADAMDGIKRTDITAGKYKRIASSNAPLSEEGQAEIQSQLDQIYSVFVEDVAANRGVSVETVLNDMADGRVFIGQKAIDAGLVDGVATLEQLIAEMSTQESPGVGPTKKPEAQPMREPKRKMSDELETPVATADDRDKQIADLAAQLKQLQSATASQQAKNEALQAELSQRKLQQEISDRYQAVRSLADQSVAAMKLTGHEYSKMFSANPSDDLQKLYAMDAAAITELEKREFAISLTEDRKPVLSTQIQVIDANTDFNLPMNGFTPKPVDASEEARLRSLAATVGGR
jgi:signal peptide peptidase SppA